MEKEIRKITPEEKQRMTHDVILGMIACLEDLFVFLDLAEAYKILPQEKIDKFRSNLDLSKM